MKRSISWRHVASLSVLLGFSSWAAWYVSRNWADFRGLLELPAHLLVLCFSGFLLSLFANGIFFRLTVQAFGIVMPHREWLSLSIVTACINFISPLRGGAGVRASYLKDRYGLSFTDFLTTIGGVLALSILAYSSLGLLALVALAAEGKSFDLPLGIFFFGVTILFGFMTFQTLRVRQRVGSFPLRQLARIINGWQLVRSNPRLFLGMLVNGALHYAASFLMFLSAFRAIGVKLSWSEAAFYTSTAATAALLSITPGALGIQESASVYMARTLPYTVSEALMAQLLVRTAAILALLILSPGAFRYLGSATSRPLRK